MTPGKLTEHTQVSEQVLKLSPGESHEDIEFTPKTVGVPRR